MLFAVLAHVDADHRALVVEEEVGQRLGQLGLADTGGAEEQKRSGGPVGVGDAGAGAPHRIGDRRHGLALTDDAAAEFVLHAQQLGGLALQQPARGDAGPRRHHIGDVVRADLLLEHDALAGVRLRQGGVELLLQFGDAAVAQLGGLGQIAVPLGPVGLAAQHLELLLDLADDVDGALLVLPAGRQLGELLLVIGQFGAQLLQPLLGCLVGLLLQRHLLDLQPAHQPFDLVDLDGPGIDLHPQPRRRLVDQVDGLVRQEPAGDVAVGQGGRGHQRGVGDPHAVVHLVAVLEAAQDADGVLDRRLADEHLLKAALQRGVLLDVFAVLVERGRTDQTKLATGQHRLDHVAGVHRALAGRAGADDGVQLVDERDDLPGGFLDLIEHGLEPLLEFAAVLRTGDHRSEVERDDGLVAQAFGHVAVDDALGEALDDRGLADTGLADEHRVVLGAPAQHLDDTANLVVAPHNRVELALAGAGGQVGGVLLQCLITGLGVRAGDACAAAHLGERLTQRLRRGAGSGEQFGDVGVTGGQPDHQVLGGDVLVVHLGRELLGGVDRRQRFPGQLRLRGRAAAGRQPLQQALVLGADGRRVDADRFQQRAGDAVGLREQSHQQVGGADLRVAGRTGGLQRGGQRRLGLRGRVERVHDTSLSSNQGLSGGTTPITLSLFRSSLRNGPGGTVGPSATSFHQPSGQRYSNI